MFLSNVEALFFGQLLCPGIQSKDSERVYMSFLDQVELTLSELLVIIDAVIIMRHFQHPWYDETESRVNKFRAKNEDGNA